METSLLIEKNVTTHEFKHMSKEPGIFSLNFECYSLNYKGLDFKKTIDITILKESEKRKVYNS
jgi:hypothetical protein